VARFRVGLTGGLAAGKSTVARRFAAAGFTVVDADTIVRELHRSCGAGARAVRELFGPGFLSADGATDVAKVADLVFRDPSARARLEASLHPLVRERFVEIAGHAGGVAVLEATKLVEAGFAPDFDLVVTVEAAPEVRIRRAIARGLSATEARARIAAQGNEEVRTTAADVVLRNDGTRAELDAEVEELVARIRAAAA